MAHWNSEKLEVTPEKLYLSRRKFLAGAGILLAGSFLASCTKGTSGTGLSTTTTSTTGFCNGATASRSTDELGNKLTSCTDIISYNNFYEFSLSKTGVASNATKFQISPWTVTIGGLVNKPASYTMSDLTAMFPPEERIYRMRCVEAWSMVIPWHGFQLSKLIETVEPTSEAKFVKFTTVYNPAQMPGQNDTSFPWPYVEGLRMDEAMQELTILATGIYGKPLPVQDGAPIRLVVPWKYGFKSIKSIVNIDFVAEMPKTFWPAVSPGEYGFYATVNPNIPHPRWSQSSEIRIGQVGGRVPTLLFNGYDQVASMYPGDMHQYY